MRATCSRLFRPGRQRLTSILTYDRSLLYSAMERITGDGFSASQFIEMSGGGNGPMELRWRVHRTFKLARQIAANLEQLEHRRKSFIYLSSGYDFVPYQDTRLRRSPAGQQFLNDPESEDGQGVYNRFSYLPGAAGQVNYAQLRQLQRMTEPGSTFADTDLAAELADLARAANRANASFYTIDPGAWRPVPRSTTRCRCRIGTGTRGRRSLRCACWQA